MTQLRTNMHFRKHTRLGTITPKGGLTLAIDLNGTAITVAIARCGRKDLFNRSLGRTIANGRLNGALAGNARGSDIEWVGAVADEGDVIREQKIFKFELPEATSLKSFIIERPEIKALRDKLLAGAK